MDYKKFQPSKDLSSLVNFYWTLEVPAQENPEKQRIIPDGCIELAFILGGDIKRYSSDVDYIIQPRAMVLGQTLSPFYIQPTGHVNTFAASFLPYGFSNFVSEPIKRLSNKETPIHDLFESSEAKNLEAKIVNALNTSERIEVLEDFLFSKLREQKTIETIVKKTVDILVSSEGGASINSLSNFNANQKRQLERKFLDKVGVSPKKLSKLIRLQSALKLLIKREDSLTNIAYKVDYYDQSHFIKDFKEFTGLKPSDFLNSKSMALSSLFYK